MHSIQLSLILLCLKQSLALLLPLNSSELTLQSNQTLDAWPIDLPWKLEINNNLDLEIDSYFGDPKPSLTPQVEVSLDWIITNITNEGASTGYLDRETYSYEGIHVLVFPSPDQPTGTQVAVPRAQVVNILTTLRAFMTMGSNGPREFLAWIVYQKESRGLLELVFTVGSPTDSQKV